MRAPLPRRASALANARTVTALIVATSALVAATLGCSAARTDVGAPLGPGTDGGGGGGGGGGDAGGGGGGGLDGGGGLTVDATFEAGESSDCSDDNKQVYAVSNENDLYRFAPATKTRSSPGRVIIVICR